MSQNQISFSQFQQNAIEKNQSDKRQFKMNQKQNHLNRLDFVLQNESNFIANKEGLIFRQDQQKKQDESSNDSQQENQVQKTNKTQQNAHAFFTSEEYLREYSDKIFPQQNSFSKDFLQLQKNIHKRTQPILYEQQSKLIGNKNFEKCKNFVDDISVLNIDQTRHSQVVTIQIQCGWYKTKIIILNLSSQEQQKSSLHSCVQVHGFGSFGNIYIFESQNQSYAVKCCTNSRIKRYHQQIKNKSKFLMGSLKEYFFLKFFSQLRIGPKIKKFFGFDLVISNQCIQFSMEICNELILNPKIEQKIVENLTKMHLFQIVHRDIKPDNLMWSQQYKTPVFIDFGGTKFIKQKIGFKTITKFVGTIGFISNEMSKVFAQKSGIADLYYNDLFGLKKSFILIKNQQHRKYNENQIKEHKQVNIVRNWELFLCMLKNRLFVKEYEEFFYLWQIMEKLFFYEIQEIEYKILEFITELPPDQILMKIYWSLREQVRNLQVFQLLKDIYSDETSMVMWIWTKFYFKKIKFQQEIALYRYIEVEYNKTLSKLQKDIQSILISNQTIQSYIKNCSESKNLIEKQNNLIIFCTVGIYYCTLAHDSHTSTLQQKISTCTQVISTLKKYEQNHIENYDSSSTNINFINLIFKCHLQEFEPISILFQYFMFKIWYKIPQRFQQETLKKGLSTLVLLGYPFYTQNGKHFLLYHLFIKQHKIQQKSNCLKLQMKMKFIVKYWKILALVKVYDQVFYDRKQQNFYLPSNLINGIVEKNKLRQKQIMKPESDHQVFEVNYNIYIFHRRLGKSYKKSFLNLNVLNESSLSKLFAESESFQKLFNQWKFYILLIINLMQKHQINETQMGFISQEKTKMLEFKDQYDYSLNFTSYLIFCKHNWNLERVIKILRIIDNMIPFSKISQRFFIQLRIFSAWKIKDTKIIKRLSQMICEETKSISIQNFNSLTQIVIIFHSILIHERKDFWFYVIRKLICLQYIYQIVKRVKSYLHFYLNQQQFQVLEQKVMHPQRSDNLSVQTQQQSLVKSRRTQEQIIYIFGNIRASLSLILTIIRFACMLLSNGKQSYRLKKSTEVNFKYKQSISPVQHLQNVLPDKLKNSLFLSSHRQQQQRQLIQSFIDKLSSPNSVYSIYYKEKQLANDRSVLDIKIGLQNNHHSLITMIDKNFTQDQLNINQSFQLNDSNFDKPSPRVISLYYISKLIINKQAKIQDYQNLINCYQTWKKKQQVSFTLLFEVLLVRYLFNAYIYCQSPHTHLFYFLLYVANQIKNFPQKFAIEVFYQVIQGKFSCDNARFFPFQPQNWKPLQFINFMYEIIPTLSLETDAYMSLVFYQCLLNNYVSHKIRKRLFRFVIKSIEILNPKARSYLFYRLYQQALTIKIVQKGWYSPAQYSQDHKQIKPQKMINFDDQMIHRQFYYAEKTFKMEDRHYDIQKFLQERFKLKKLRKPHWKIPYLIEKKYRKKLYRYHFIRGGFDDNEFQVDPHLNLINQLCQQK